ncbi:MAG TPA: spore coat U domain-containing protein [Terracidiphilus sp.]|nr:spore coat U domain-containing protein [Terracidiphilus sp.]
MKNRIMSSAILAAAGVMALGLSSVANAATTTTATFAVTANVAANCTIAANPLAFGSYTGAVNNATTTVTAQCTNSTPYNIGLNAGTASGATVTSRQMQFGANLLNYKLTSDSAHAVNWGNTVGTDTVTGTGSGAVQTLTVYGQIPASQFVTPGAYSDTITATLTY